jgi:cobalt-zinc-cadmium efflux system membrane fusion protein
MMMRIGLWPTLSVLVALACSTPEVEQDEHAGEEHSDLVVLDSLQLASAELEYSTAQVLPPDTLPLTGSVTFDAARVSHVGPRMQGRVQRVPVDIGQSVEAGDTLAVLDSPELGAAQATWFAAAVERDVDQLNHERAERLYSDGIVSERRRLEAEAEYRQAEGALAAAERTLAALGAQPDSTAASRFVLRAPLSGVVVDKHATIGEVVGSESHLFTVADLSLLWILLDVYETDLARIVVGAPAIVVTEAYPGRLLDGRIGYIGAVVDTISRTIKVRVELPNPDGILKPGMFVRANLVLADRVEVIGVSTSAVQTLEGNSVVFVPEGGGQFRVTPVVTGRRRAGGWIEVLEGLAFGDSVVTTGSFSLKSDLLKASFGEEGH